MKKLFLLVILFFANVTAHSQKLSLNELFALCNKPNWDAVNEYMLKKGWEYHESSKGDDSHYNTITWSYEKEYFSEKAKGWFYLYTYEGYPNKISYSFFNKPSYNVIKNGITAAGMKLIDNSIEDNEIVAKYEGSNFTVTVSTAKREKEDSYYSNNTITEYSVIVIKKAGVYDNDNGLKKTFDSFGNLESEFNLKNGKINGIAKLYYSNGQIKVVSNFLNGKKHGNSKEYDESGDLQAEYNYLNDKPNGIYKLYENGKLKKLGGMLNGEKNGQFKIYNEDSRIDKEYNMKLGLLDGAYTEYYYNENKLFAKETGFYSNDHKIGLWKITKIKESGTELIEYKTYVNDLKHGAFKEVSEDSIIFGTYKNGILNGSYKVYKSISAWIFGGMHGDTTNCPLIVTGSYNEGQKNGYWKYYSLLKQLIEEGQYYNDLKIGEWKYYFDNHVDEKSNPFPYSGKLFLIENYENGKMNGKQTRFAFLERKNVPCDTTNYHYVNLSDTCYDMVYQKLFQIANYANDDLHGSFEQKDSTGIVTFKGNFIYGKKDGVWLESYISEDIEGSKYYIFLKGNYSNGLKNGNWAEFGNQDLIYTKYSYYNGKLNGKTTYYNRYKKPREEKYFENGQLIKLDIYDSLGDIIHRSYEIFDETSYSLKCKKTEYYINGKTSQVYTLIKKNREKINHNFFELIFSISIGKKSDGSSGYPDGEFKIYGNKGKILNEGALYKNNKIGVWKSYYYDINVFTEQTYNNNTCAEEKYLILTTGKLFSGKFIQNFENGELKYEFKISSGLRNGKSKYYNESGKLIKTEKYKRGRLQ